ncbi:MAG: Crp/Fnr family transcriptional regulator [Actinobacteria bacterium]|nr:Crp/Fnr family transcriptional regulator [Actinomycetota bacterium]
MAAHGVPHRVGRGHAITRQGEPVTCLYVVREGAVRLSALSRGGREVVVACLCAGELFGELALLGEGPSPVEARALEDTTLLALPVERLRSALASDPDVAAELLGAIAARLRRSTQALQDALLLDAGTRLSRRLCELARDYGAPASEGVLVRLLLTQEDLARMVGASRETVNKSLAALSSRGLVRTEGRRYVIPDPDALQRLGGGWEVTAPLDRSTSGPSG